MRTCARRSFRPALEALEAREVPAVFLWTGAVSTNALDAANWSSMEEPGGLPGEDDHLYFTGGLVANPGELGGPPSPPPISPSVNCDNLQSLGSGFAGVHIESSYTGTVTMGEALTFGTFELANGAISQSASAFDLTVTGTFNWTGGVLNSSTTAATFTLSGATATVDPGANNTITTGSTLNLVARETGNGLVGTNATFSEGTVLFTNGLGLLIDNLCSAYMQPKQPQAPTAKVQFEGQNPFFKSEVKIKSGGSLTVLSGSFETNEEQPLIIEGGTFQLNGSSTATFRGRATAFNNQGPLVQLTNGQIKLTQGSTLTADHGITLTKGANGAASLQTLWHVGNGAINQAQPDANIVGNLVIDGADIVFCTDKTNRLAFARLVVTGGVNWSNSFYRPVVYGPGGNNAPADRWYATGEFNIGANAVIAPGTVNAQGVPNVLQPPVGQTWLVIESLDRLTLNAIPEVRGKWLGFTETELVNNMQVPKRLVVKGIA